MREQNEHIKTYINSTKTVKLIIGNINGFFAYFLESVRCNIEFKCWFRLTLIKENGINEITISY